MQQPRGGFASAEDADSPISSGKQETSEGVLYIWNATEIESVVSKLDAALFEYAYGVEHGGNVPAHQDVRGELKGKNVFYEAHSTEETAKKFGLTVEQTTVKLTAGRRTLFEARTSRPRPPLDDKIITAWNGRMISALSRTSQALDEPRYLEPAQPPAKFLQTHLYRSK